MEASLRALEIDKTNRDALYSKGLALEGLKRYAEALACYQRAREIDPTDEASRERIEVVRALIPPPPHNPLPAPTSVPSRLKVTEAPVSPPRDRTPLPPFPQIAPSKKSGWFGRLFGK